MKNSLFNRFFVRNFEAGNLLENFFVSSVSSFLFIRFFLKIFNYPSLGKGGLHVAHMLWGGLLMFLALVICFGFLTKIAQNFASIIGGIGFGTFIDELGKFITRDNNYFFQPTIALIYIVFVLLFFLQREMEKFQPKNDTEYLINAFEVSKEAVINDLNEKEKEKALLYLNQYSEKNPFIVSFINMFNDIKVAPDKKNIFLNFAGFIKTYYQKLVKKPWFLKIIIFIFLFQLLSLTQHVWELIKTLPFLFPSDIPFYRIAELFFSMVSGVLSLLGIVRLTKNRILGYITFKKSVLVSIFLTQFFAFYSFQLYALSNLAINLIILSALNFAIEKETAIID